MSLRKLFYFSNWFLVLFLIQNFVCAQEHPPASEPAPFHTEDTQPPDPSITQTSHLNVESPVIVIEPAPVTRENLIHYGDLIDVDVVGSTEYDWRGKLNPEGFLSGISFNENPIYGLCRTEADVAADIAKGYSKLLNNPQVVVKILDRSDRPISILYGAVKTPQRFQIQRPVHLNELLILSGGITERASGDIQILRPPKLGCEDEKIDDQKKTEADSEQKEKFITAKQENGSQNIKVKISELIKGSQDANPLILSGDVVTVLEAQPIYIVGGVANPKQINAHSQITLSRAISIAGGFTKDADPKKITVFRREQQQTKAIEINFEKIKANADNDLVLQALDIVDVTRTGREKK